MSGWSPLDAPADPPIGPLGWLRALVVGLTMALIVYGLLVIFWLVRLVELPFGRRIYSPGIVRLACRISLGLLRIPVSISGTPMDKKGAVVSNHASWLDIFTLNAPQRIFFVSKAEVSSWPAIGILARSTGTVFIERRTAHARRHKSQFEDRLVRGDKLLFFPEGTSTDSMRVLPFKSSLFAAFFEPHLVDEMWIQPMTVNYHAPDAYDPRFYGWWGEMTFVPHLVKILGAARVGRIDISFHEAVRVRDFENRKALARYCEDKVRGGLVLEGQAS